jgi:DnaJ-class molecular chaperone
MSNEKRVKRGFSEKECYWCLGSGIDPLSVLIRKTCSKCNGTGKTLREDSREEETVSYER